MVLGASARLKPGADFRCKSIWLRGSGARGFAI